MFLPYLLSLSNEKKMETFAKKPTSTPSLHPLFVQNLSYSVHTKTYGFLISEPPVYDHESPGFQKSMLPLFKSLVAPQITKTACVKQKAKLKHVHNFRRTRAIPLLINTCHGAKGCFILHLRYLSFALQYSKQIRLRYARPSCLKIIYK